MVLRKFRHGLANVVNKIGYHGKPFKEEELDAVIKELKADFDLAGPCTKSIEQYKPPMPELTQNHKSINAERITLNFAADPDQAAFDKDKKISSRKAFGYALAAAGRVDERVFVLDADVKNSTYTEMFEAENPDRFVQCFVAEQNMVGVATGLQLRGKIPFSATFAAFFARAHDQIRMAGIGRNALRLCGTHVGVSIGEDGPSQMGLEDIALMRSVPHSIVLYPSDGVSTYKMVELMANYNNGISYLRSTRGDAPILYDKNDTFEIGGCKVLRQAAGDQVLIIGAGITLHEALKAHEDLKKSGIQTSVIDLYSVKPLDAQTIKRVAKASENKIIVVEDHYPQGGIGEAVLSALMNEGFTFKMLAVNDISRSGSPADLLKLADIDAEAIVKAVQNFV